MVAAVMSSTGNLGRLPRGAVMAANLFACLPGNRERVVALLVVLEHAGRCQRLAVLDLGILNHVDPDQIGRALGGTDRRAVLEGHRVPYAPVGIGRLSAYSVRNGGSACWSPSWGGH